MFSKLQMTILSLCLVGAIVIFGILEYPKLPLLEQFVSQSIRSSSSSENPSGGSANNIPDEASTPESPKLPPHRETARDKADDKAIDAVMDKFANVFADGDYSYVVDNMYKPIVQKLGGREKAIEDAKAVAAMLKAQRMNFESWKAVKPYSYYNGVTNRYAVIPYEMEMSYYGKTIKQKGYELGIKVPGSKWQFINGDTLTPAIIEAFFPDFPTNVDLPNLQQGYE